MADKVSVLFVCLGNICRSTMAEGIFQELAKRPEYAKKIGKIDSCGTGALNRFVSRLFTVVNSNGINERRICSCVSYWRIARSSDAVNARG